MERIATLSCLLILLAGCARGDKKRAEQPAAQRSQDTTAVASVQATGATATVRPDLAPFFQKHNVAGCFVLYDLNAGSYVRYNPERCDQGYVPASTYKIFNSLVALESGVAPDENMVIRWDGTKRGGAWDQDHDMRMAFKNSTLWYYQEIARRVGEERMRYYLEREKYGNSNIEGGIDQFWLTGGLRITPNQQVEFLQRLYKGELGFSERTMNIVRDIMKLEETPTYIMRAKTGWGQNDSMQIGWIVGWVEKSDNTYFFALNIGSRDKNFPMKEARLDILNAILTELKVR